MAAEKNLARTLSVNYVWLTIEVLKALPRTGLDLDAVRDRLFDRIWGSDLTERQKLDRLMSRAGWDELEMAVLDARHLALTDDQVPATQAELSDLCDRLLSRDGDDDLLRIFASGWAGQQPPLGARRQFVEDLWAVRSRDRKFYAAVVSGRHHDAVEMMVERRLPGTIDDVAIHILVRMALIWAAFDVQATAARVRRSMTRPFGRLVSGSGQRMRAATAATVFRPFARLFETLSAHYRKTADSTADGDDLRVRRPAVADIRKRAAGAASDIERDEGGFAMDGPIAAAIDRYRHSDNPLLQQLRRTKSDAEFGYRQMAEVWYGLLPLQAVGLAVIRLVQMEQKLEPILRQAISEARVQSASVSLTIPDFDAAVLTTGWKVRVRRIVDALRVAVLKDGDLHTVRKLRKERRRAAGKDIWEGPAHDDRYIDEAIAFLRATPRDVPLLERDEWSERRHSLYMLDIATERRFQESRRGNPS